MPREADTVSLSSNVTVARYRALEAAMDRAALALFVRERFEERYFRPAFGVKGTRHGFTLMAIACLVIETLEAFYQGIDSTRGRSREMFAAFFARPTQLRVFGGDQDWFYQHIRCGILHQGEARGGWRILRRGPLLDNETRSINALLFLRAVRNAVAEYSYQIEHDDAIWRRFKLKMAAVCGAC